MHEYIFLKLKFNLYNIKYFINFIINKLKKILMRLFLYYISIYSLFIVVKL